MAQGIQADRDFYNTAMKAFGMTANAEGAKLILKDMRLADKQLTK